MDKTSKDLPSFICFGPQSRPPTPEYLTYLRQCINEDDHLKPLKDAIYALPHTWKLYIEHSPQLLTTAGKTSLDLLWNWLQTGDSPWKEQCPPGVLTTPLLVIVQSVQYVKYLEINHISHENLLQSVAVGGVHGYCGGFLCAAAVATASRLQDAVENFCTALRVSVGIGAYSDLVDANDDGKPNTLALRLKDERDADALAAEFPNVSHLQPEL